MAFETTRSSILAVTEEVTEGTPVFPTAGTDCIALTPGFDFAPNFETLENEELTGTIAASAPVQGLESPTASFTNYAKGSGTEGAVADWGILLKNAHGSQTINATERLTDAGSTAGSSSARAVLKLASGGADFDKGYAVLIKDGTHSYRIRNVHDVSTNDLTLSQNIPAAPASGIGVGKCINYGMLDSVGSLSAWLYRGNGGAVELITGAKVSSYTLNIPAGGFISFNWNFVGKSYYFNPIEIKATNKYIDFNEGAGAVTATLTEGVYRDPEELRIHVESVLDAAATATITVTYSDTSGKYTIASNGLTFELDFLTGTNNANTAALVLGYTKTDKSGATTYTAETGFSYAFGYTPVYSAQSPLVAKNNELMIGGFDDYLCTAASNVTVNFGKEPSNVTSICEPSGVAGSVFNGRGITVDVTGYLARHDLDKWLRFKNNTDCIFTYNAGVKSGGNWVKGTCLNMHSEQTKISSINIGDESGVATLNMTLTCYGSGSRSDFYMNTL